MGSNGARYAVLAAAVAAVVALFVVLSGGDDDGPAGTRAATTETAKKPSGGAPDPPKDHEQKKQKPRAKVPTIEIKGGQPVGGVQRLEFRKGEDIVFRVGSDTADHVHLIDHGAVVWQGSARELHANERILTTYLGV